jgi:2-oxoisovalerate dehydrogenase E1 component
MFHEVDASSEDRPGDPGALARLYRTMVRIRQFEVLVSQLYRDGEVPGFCHVSIGQEAVAAGVAAALRPEDVITSTHRGHGHVLAKGADPAGMLAELMGKPSGVCAGLGGSMHIADIDMGIYGANGIVGGGLPIAVGAAFAARRAARGQVVVAFFGDGAVSQGTFHESVNLAALWTLPVLFVCENNHFAEFSAARTQHPVDVLERARGYGIEGVRVDGCDVEAMYDAVRRIVADLRDGGRPVLLEADTERWHGHYEGDPVSYRPRDDERAMRLRDPIARAGERLGAAAVGIDGEVSSELHEALETARAAPRHAPHDLSNYVRAPMPVAVPEPLDAASPEQIRYIDAIRAALADAMGEDEAVFVAGIDVGAAGGIFRATAGLFDRFGGERVIDTPISESALVGLGTGAALSGMRPVLEIMFIDFVAVCFDQIVNQAAKLRFMTGGRCSVPLVIRTQYGAGRSAAAQHSQSLEGVLSAFPGLAVVMPSTPADVYGLLRSAIDDPNPVIFIEHRHLYSSKGSPAASGTRTPIGKAAVRRPGRDVTVVAAGRLVHEALRAAENLDAENVSVEVIDLRTISPIDRETIADSVHRTGRLAAVQEAPGPFGPAAEVIVAAQELAFWSLDAPPVRVAPPAAPAPYAAELEQAWLPSAASIERAVRELVAT